MASKQEGTGTIELPGPLWKRMLALERFDAASLTRSDVPTSIGIYVWLRNGSPVYSGRAVGGDGLKGRVWDNHLKTSPDLSRSSFRRNVCEYLGIADTGVARQRPTRLTPQDVAPVNDWIRECQVAWLEFGAENLGQDVDAVKRFEKDLHAEWFPPLSKE